MHFHAEKCKVLSINHFHYNLFTELPFFLYSYQINDVLLDYCKEEKDLGIIITNKFHFTNHHFTKKRCDELKNDTTSFEIEPA